MKRTHNLVLTGASTLLLCGAAFFWAQGSGRSQSKASADGISVGSNRVEIGIAREKVFSLLQDEYELSATPPDELGRSQTWGLRRKNSQKEAGEFGALSFRDGKLVRVTRNHFASDGPGARELAYGLVSAISQLEREGNITARVHVEQKTNDNTTLTLHFGQRELKVVVYDASPGSSHGVLLYEASQ